MFLGRDSNGQRIRRTETVRGKKSDAQHRLREILSDLDRGIAPARNHHKVGEWMAEVIIPNKRQKTIDRYECDIRLHIKPTLSHVDLTKLSPVQVQHLESKLLQEGKAPKGVQGVHNVLARIHRRDAVLALT